MAYSRWRIQSIIVSKLLRIGFRYILKTYNNVVPSCLPDMGQIGYVWDVVEKIVHRQTTNKTAWLIISLEVFRPLLQTLLRQVAVRLAGVRRH